MADAREEVQSFAPFSGDKRRGDDIRKAPLHRLNDWKLLDFRADGHVSKRTVYRQHAVGSDDGGGGAWRSVGGVTLQTGRASWSDWIGSIKWEIGILQGAASATADTASTEAQQLFVAHVAMPAVAAVQLGSDTYLFVEQSDSAAVRYIGRWDGA